MLLISPILLPITQNCRIFSFYFMIWILSYFRILTICLLFVYFVSAAGCHCFDFCSWDFKFNFHRASLAILLILGYCKCWKSLSVYPVPSSPCFFLCAFSCSAVVSDIASSASPFSFPAET